MNYAIDLALRPSTFDLWHVCMAGTIAILLVIISVLLSIMVMTLMREQKVLPPVVQPTPPELPEPIVQIVEKIVEVEKIVHAPAPEPVILKEATEDAALQLLSLLQKEARFIDFVKEDMSEHSDADVGMVARVIHEGCNKALNEHFTIDPVRSELEGDKITLPVGFDAAQVRLTGNIVGSAPFTGTLIHKGWQVTNVRLPKLTQGYNAHIIASAEVEL